MTKISHQTFSLRDFKTEGTLASHCPTDWSHFQHCSISVQDPNGRYAVKRK